MTSQQLDMSLYFHLHIVYFNTYVAANNYDWSAPNLPFSMLLNLSNSDS